MIKHLSCQFVRIFTLLVLMLCVLVFSVFYTLDRPLEYFEIQDTDQYIFEVAKGSNLNQITRHLADQSIIKYPKLLTVWALVVKEQDIKAGEYQIIVGDSALSILDKFSRGQVVSRSITFPEGWSFKQWINHLARFEQFAYLMTKSTDEILQQSGIDLTHPEGWFYPDTYNFTKQDNLADILSQAHARMQLELENAWQQKKQGLPYQSPYEALIMASIIEKETGRADERRAIAGVFVRRLEKGMRLQTDPTVIYGLGDDYDGDLRKKDLLHLTPYNTYRINGLPPTPIAMPGSEAIKAALNPLEGSSYYFVARGDGSHQFSDTIAEHVKAVRYYQIEKRASNYQSAPQ
jgi:UPF0755 protein